MSFPASFLVGLLICIVAASHAAVADWGASVSVDRSRVQITGKATDERITFYGGCNRLLVPGVYGSIDGYAGDALERIDDGNSEVIFAVRLAQGSREFPATVHYFAPDKAWVVSDPPLPVAFMDAFGTGDRLTVRSAKGETVAEFDLKGAGKAAQTMRRVCR